MDEEKVTHQVLVVEDDPFFARQLELTMELEDRWAFDLLSAHTCAEAIHRLSTKIFDVMLVDLGLPDSTGAQTVRQLREVAPRTPIVVLTGTSSDAPVALAALRAGAQDYLCKDEVTPPRIARALRYAIERFTVISQLEARNRDLRSFTSFIAHDIREPLRTISMHLGLIKKRAELEPALQESLDFAASASDRLSNMVRALLDLARRAESKLTLRPTDLDAICSGVLRDLAMTVKENDATVNVGHLPMVLADGAQIGQVFQNLIANAIRYRSAEPPRVEIRAEHTAEAWRIEIQDNGIGIDESQLGRIFEPAINSQHPDSLGLGLAVCEQIVQRHGGRIWAESSSKQGSTFFFTIPNA